MKQDFEKEYLGMDEKGRREYWKKWLKTEGK